jgi:hypothetical protein
MIKSDTETIQADRRFRFFQEVFEEATIQKRLKEQRREGVYRWWKAGFGISVCWHV